MKKFYDVAFNDPKSHLRKPKPYFTKYLPVEGEIKEGDKFFHLGILGTCLKGERWEGEKPVKLFLCSRDIQVGDKVFNPDDGKYYIYQANMDNEYLIKVIGEISPNASWVTEGMEFDKDQWQWAQFSLSPKAESQWDTNVLGFRTTGNERYNNWGHDRIVIMCPHCKTFL